MLLHSSSPLSSLSLLVLPTSGKAQRWVVLNFEVSATRASAVSGRTDDIKRPQVNVCNACLNSPGWSSSRQPSPGVILCARAPGALEHFYLVHSLSANWLDCFWPLSSFINVFLLDYFWTFLYPFNFHKPSIPVQIMPTRIKVTTPLVFIWRTAG